MKRGELSVSSTAVGQAVIDAIRHFETRHMWFNEKQITAVTTPNTATLSVSVAAMIKIDSLNVAYSGRKYYLDAMNHTSMDQIDTGQYTGYPQFYAWYADKIRMYPPPNATYTVTISYIQRLPEVTLSSPASATNGWVNEAELMIRKRAKGELFANELRNAQEAAYWFQQAEDEYKAANKVTVGRQSGKIKPTKF